MSIKYEKAVLQLLQIYKKSVNLYLITTTIANSKSRVAPKYSA